MQVCRATTLLFYGLSIGLGVQQPIFAAMAYLSGKDGSLGTSLIMFIQVMSGTIMVSVGQNLFTQRLTSKLAAEAPGVSLQVVLAAGNEGLVEQMSRVYSQTQVGEILVAYNETLNYVFLLSTVLSCLTIIGAAGMEWRNINKKREEAREVGE